MLGISSLCMLYQHLLHFLHTGFNLYYSRYYIGNANTLRQKLGVICDLTFSLVAAALSVGFVNQTSVTVQEGHSMELCVDILISGQTARRIDLNVLTVPGNATG